MELWKSESALLGVRLRGKGWEFRKGNDTFPTSIFGSWHKTCALWTLGHHKIPFNWYNLTIWNFFQLFFFPPVMPLRIFSFSSWKISLTRTKRGVKWPSHLMWFQQEMWIFGSGKCRIPSLHKACWSSVFLELINNGMVWKKQKLCCRFVPDLLF